MTLTARPVLILLICALVAGGCGSPYKKERLTQQRGWRFGPYNATLSPQFDVDSLGNTDITHVHGITFRVAPNRDQNKNNNTSRFALELDSAIVRVKNQPPILFPPSSIIPATENQVTEGNKTEYQVSFDTSYSYDDIEMVSYRLRLVDQTTGQAVDSLLADEYCRVGLKQKYPNPFCPSTTISFVMPSTDNYLVTIYDIYGKKVGSHEGSGAEGELIEFDWDGSGFDSGVYFYKLEVADFTETKKMIYLR